MIHIRNVSLSYGSQTIFRDISCDMLRGDRIGLVGRNGSGKTSLLRLLAGIEQPDAGSIDIAKSAKIAYMPQEVVLHSDKSVFDETFTAFHEICALEAECTLLMERLQAEHDAVTFERYATRIEKLQQLDPARARAKTDAVLGGLGFSRERFTIPVSTLSMGWKMRVVLAKLLLSDADFYCFDEPTNHLDLPAKEWFVRFLQQTTAGFLLVCHEQYVMDEVCTRIFELDRGVGTVYAGNYTYYEQQKAAVHERRAAAYLQQQKEIADKERTIARFRAGTRATMALSMERALAKIERLEPPSDAKTAALSLPVRRPSGRHVVTVSHLSYAFGDTALFRDVSFEVERGQRVAIVAPNGAGKTTLLHLIAGLLKLQAGTVTFGHNVDMALFVQDQMNSLNPDRSVLENVLDKTTNVPEEMIRSVLGALLFSGDDIKKPVRVLSGGERNRVGIACTSLQRANFLILDEPTNHLDIPSKRILRDALRSYSGTLLFVSHDRDFVDAVATHILSLSSLGVRMYEGSYSEFRAAEEARDAQVPSPVSRSSKAAVTAPSATPQPRDHARIRAVEKKIATLEKRIAALEMTFADLVYGAPQFTRAQAELVEARAVLEALYAEWEQLTFSN